jgi:hypothetical protein
MACYALVIVVVNTSSLCLFIYLLCIGIYHIYIPAVGSCEFEGWSVFFQASGVWGVWVSLQLVNRNLSITKIVFE